MVQFSREHNLRVERLVLVHHEAVALLLLDLVRRSLHGLSDFMIDNPAGVVWSNLRPKGSASFLGRLFVFFCFFFTDR